MFLVKVMSIFGPINQIEASGYGSGKSILS